MTKNSYVIRGDYGCWGSVGVVAVGNIINSVRSVITSAEWAGAPKA